MKRAGLAIAVVAGVLALVHAISKCWLSDDAFITFRYADHLAHGHGLVFNLGERVEGDTNFLWTLWIAVGRLFGASATGWSIVWSIACYMATIALLARRSLQLDDMPSAVLFGAAHVAWAEFATSGLETSAFTLLAFAGYVLVCPQSETAPSRRRIAAAGAVFALAALTRPDGILFGAVAGVWLLAQKRVRDGLVLAAAFAIVWVPPTAWRTWYYGDFFPNTYYAKSAWIPWWSQGGWYALRYLERYLPFALVPLALVMRPRRRAALELAMVAVYALYVMRVGGDFMFARLFVPLTPFLALLLQRAIMLCQPRVRVVLAVAAAASLWWIPTPRLSFAHGGVLDERHYYTIGTWARDSDAQGAVLARQLRGLPVVLAFNGAAARVVYRSDVPTAIECATGLTDRTIAHQPLHGRGRVGHEKPAWPGYLFARGVDFAVWPFEIDGLTERLPHLAVDLGGVRLVVLAWHPAILDAVLARGATFPRLAHQLAQELARWPDQQPALVTREMDLFWRALQSLPSAAGGDRSRPR